MDDPLSGIFVLDLSQLLPGPYCSLILADYGAEVIKIERPGGGDWLRFVPPLDPESGASVLFEMLNRGKKSLTLDLKTDEGQGIFLRLVETADVLINSFRPGVMERLGLNYTALAELNPRLVYCSLTGYGHRGPYRGRAGHDLNYIGLGGLLDPNRTLSGVPTIPSVPVADLAGALWAAVGILLAIVARGHTGKGQCVDATLLGGALACLPVELAEMQGPKPMTRRPGSLSGGVVCYNVYATADGKFVTLAALEPQFWAAFCQTAECEELMGQQFAPALPGEPIYDQLCMLFRSRTRAEWAEAMSQVDACCEPVYTLEEALAAAPVQALEMLFGQDLRFPVRLSARQEHSSRRAPALGEHTETIMKQLGYDDSSIVELRQRKVV